jgi:hypothetical protein
VRADFTDRLLQRGRHVPMHRGGIAPFHEKRLVAIADKQRFQFFVADTRENRRIRDLVAVEVQDREHSAVADRIQELVRVPRGRERTRFGFTITDHARHDGVGMIERHPVGMGQAVAEFAAFVNRAWRFRCDMAADVTGERELLEELPHPLKVFALVRIDLGVGAFEIGRSQHARRAMPGTRNEDDVQIMFDDQAVEMHPDEGQRGACTPVSEQPVLHMVHAQRLFQQRVVGQINHPNRQVVARSPVGVHQPELLR